MVKSYVRDLSEWVEQKKGINAKSANSAKVIFFAIRDDVKEAIDAGYALVTIWEHLHETGRVNTTYETFRRHVHRYIKNKSSVIEIKKEPPAIANKAVKSASRQPQKAEQKTSEHVKTGLTKFEFSPKK